MNVGQTWAFIGVCSVLSTTDCTIFSNKQCQRLVHSLMYWDDVLSTGIMTRLSSGFMGHGLVASEICLKKWSMKSPSCFFWELLFCQLIFVCIHHFRWVWNNCSSLWPGLYWPQIISLCKQLLKLRNLLPELYWPVKWHNRSSLPKDIVFFSYSSIVNIH
jgi:hypothetical protein